jgi:septal ring factor EnvC (AmiA/AmiB activator)
VTGRRGLAGILCLLAVATGVAAAPRGGDPLRTKQKALGEVRRQLGEAQAKASAARKRESSLLAELERIDRTLKAKRGELARLNARIVELEGELVRLEGHRERVSEDAALQEAQLAARLGILARLVATPAPPAWLGEAERLGRDRAVADLTRLAGQDVARLEAFGETAERLQARRLRVSQGRRELVRLRGTVLAQRVAMDSEATRRRGLLRQVREDRATHERLAGELADAARRLEGLVRDLARRAEARARARPAVARPGGPPAPRAASQGPAVGLGALRGQLPWPTDGRIVAAFGPEVHPRFGTEVLRRGVDIEAAEGAPIRAVFAGIVLYRGWLRGYGNLIVLDHGEGYYTLYAHASEILVDDGDAVRAGQRIARVGDTGSVEGPRLYFEVRYQGRAEDPQAWLRRRP